MKSPNSPYPELHAKAYNVPLIDLRICFEHLSPSPSPCCLDLAMLPWQARVVAAWLSDLTCELLNKSAACNAVDGDLQLLASCMQPGSNLKGLRS